MGRAFTGQEKGTIYDSLLTIGKEMFATYGIKKTTVDDVVVEAGISKGTFYKFFKSKEDFFQKIFELEVRVGRQKMASLLSEHSQDPRECLKSFINNYIGSIEKNTLFQKTVLQNGNMPGLKSMVTEEIIQKRREEWIGLLSAHVKKWQEKGVMIKGEPELIAGTIRSVVYLLFHKHEIGDEVFPKIINFWSDALSSALVKEG